MKWISSLALLVGLALGQCVTAATVFVDFGDSTQTTAGNYYNDIIVNAPTTLSIADMIDSTGASTGAGISISGFFPGSNLTGHTAPTGAAAIFAATATRDNAFGHTGPFSGNDNAPLGTVSLTGLNPSQTYDFTFFASRIDVTDNRETQYDVSGANSGIAFLDASNNASSIVVVSGIQPTGAGTVSIAVSAGPNNNNGSKFYYLGAMMISSAAIPEPTSALLAALAGIGFLFRRR